MTTLKDSGIYCIKHVESGRCYVGSAENFDRRFKAHLTKLSSGKHHSSKLQEAWNRFGGEAFEIVVLERCIKEELIAREQQWIDMLEAAVVGYNVAEWAKSPMKGKTHSDETRQKMRDSHKGRKPISEETRQKLRDMAKRREERKRQEGFEVSEETRAKLSEAGKGREFDEETRAKISASNKGRRLTEEQQERQRESLTGRKLSEEHKAAVAEGNRRYWERVREGVSMNNQVSQE